ncbi:MAG: hypothetical protein IT212_07640 [Bacteroidia bacterium]|nr:hypothetical protein [Bacteroidia bacterium]
MARNTIQMIERVATLNDRVKSARFPDSQYIDALNEATDEIVNSLIDSRVGQKQYAQSSQQSRDKLTPIIPAPATGALSAGVVPIPADYKYLLLLYVTISGVKTLVRPTDYNKQGEVEAGDPFAKPTDMQVYYNERATGLTVLSGVTTPSAYELWYYKQPTQMSIGKESDKIASGSVLTNAIVYYAYDQTLYNSITYYPGDAITGVGGAGALYVSGTVIASAKIVNTELVELNDEVCKLASSIMMGTVEDYNKKQSLQADVDRI